MGFIFLICFKEILEFPSNLKPASRTFVSWKNRTILAVRVTGNYLWNSPRDDFRTISAMKQNTWADTSSTLVAILGRSIPNFVFAVLLQYIFAIKLQVLPIAKWDGFVYTILPTIALAMSPLADSARFIRTEMVEVLHSDYVELAKAKGLSRWEIAFKHGLRNSLIPLMTLLGPLAVALMTGSLVVENIFAIPGIGEQFVKSITTNDYPTIMAVTILYSFMLILLF